MGGAEVKGVIVSDIEEVEDCRALRNAVLLISSCILPGERGNAAPELLAGSIAPVFDHKVTAWLML